MSISPVNVTLKENDKRGVTASPTALTVAAGIQWDLQSRSDFGAAGRRNGDGE